MRNHFLRAAGVPSGSYVTDNLVFHLDFENTDCWSGSGTEVTCLAGKGTKSIEDVSLSTTGVNHLVCTDQNDQGPAFFAVPTQYDDYSGSETLTDDFIPSVKADETHSYTTPSQVDFSIELWLKLENTDWVSSARYLLDCSGGQSPATSRRSWRMTAYKPSDDEYRRLRLYPGWSGLRLNIYPKKDDSDSSWWPDYDEWVHLVLVIPSGTYPDWKVYVNNVDVSDEDNVESTGDSSGWRTFPLITSNLSNHSHWFTVFGSTASSNKSQKGSIGLVRLYNGKALSAEEVEQNYNAEKSNFGY